MPLKLSLRLGFQGGGTNACNPFDRPDAIHDAVVGARILAFPQTVGLSTAVSDAHSSDPPSTFQPALTPIPGLKAAL